MAIGHNIADGQVASSEGTIYTAGADEIITALTIVNGHTAATTNNVKLNRSGTARYLFKKDLVLQPGEKASLDCSAEKHTLESGDVIRAADGQGSVTDYLVTTLDIP